VTGSRASIMRPRWPTSSRCLGGRPGAGATRAMIRGRTNASARIRLTANAASCHHTDRPEGREDRGGDHRDRDEDETEQRREHLDHGGEDAERDPQRPRRQRERCHGTSCARMIIQNASHAVAASGAVATRLLYNVPSRARRRRRATPAVARASPAP
jgi:hypothetical protein